MGISGLFLSDNIESHKKWNRTIQPMNKVQVDGGICYEYTIELLDKR